ncbi:cytochrome bd oxidase small subunit CydS [Cerasibacillus terrae]
MNDFLITYAPFIVLILAIILSFIIALKDQTLFKE